VSSRCAAKALEANREPIRVGPRLPARIDAQEVAVVRELMNRTERQPVRRSAR
jgi:hypothetical protein